MNISDPYSILENLNHFYVEENITTESEDECFAGCDCLEVCHESCSCLKNGIPNYKISEKLLLNENKTENIYECNTLCKCVNVCGNRLVQFGPNKYLEIRDTIKGKGLFPTQKIQCGEFICEYAGEIITKDKAIARWNERNGAMNYILCVNEYFGENLLTTIVDPTFYGNIGRYINHSCEPNCKIEPVRVNSTIPKLCIFAIKSIEIGEEITFDYGESLHGDTSTLKLTPCLCKSENCKKWMPFFHEAPPIL